MELPFVDWRQIPHQTARIPASEVMTIQVLFHLSGIRTFKKFYTDYFPGLVSYNRFTELSGQMIVPLAIYLKTKATGQCTGIAAPKTF